MYNSRIHLNRPPRASRYVPTAMREAPRLNLGVVPYPQEAILTIQTDRANIILANEPTVAKARRVRVVVGPGVNVYSTNVANAAIDGSGLRTGTVLIIHNAGTIWGKGGNGGSGNSNNAQAGGDAIKGPPSGKVIVVNNGNVWGGGGGGGAGQSLQYNCGSCTQSVIAGGGGGGGGAGYVTGSGHGLGGGGAGSSGICTASNGGTGGNGTISSGGSGGGGGSATCQTPETDVGCSCTSPSGGGGAGGANGGGLGAAGSSSTWSGGAGGKAININGGAGYIYIGNNATQVKGTIA